MYMPPEQSTGQKDIGPTADIYSLGATLYEMIAGRPPFRGSTVMDTLKMVQSEEPLAPRQLQPSVPSDLQTICLKCLHKDPKQRYVTAEAFADDLRNYLEGKPIAARPVSKMEKAWKWSRRNPAAALLIGVSCASLIAFGIGGVSFAIIESRRAEQEAILKDEAVAAEGVAVKAKARAEEQEQEAQRQKTKAQEARKVAEEQRELAILRGREALENFQSAQKAVDVLVRTARERMQDERHMETVGRELLEKALAFYDGLLVKKPNDPQMRVQVARAQMLAGDLREKLGRFELADQSYALAEKTYNDLLKEFPERSTELRRDLATVYINRSTLLQVLKKEKEADDAFAGAQALLDKARVDKVLDPASDWMMAAGCNNRGGYLHQRGQFEAAEKAYRQAIDLFGRLAHEYPRELDYQVELARTRTNLAELWVAQPEPSRAQPLYDQAIAELTPIRKQAPEIPSFTKEFSRTLMNRGKFYAKQGRYREADQDLAHAARITDDLLGAFPAVADYRFLAAAVQMNLANSKEGQKKWQEAIDAYRRADGYLVKLTTDEPKILAYQHNWAFCASNMAVTLERQLQEAVKAEPAVDKAWAPLAKETERCWYDALGRWKTVNRQAPDINNAAEVVKAFARLNTLHKYLAGAWRKLNPAEAEVQLERRVAICKEMVAAQPNEKLLKQLNGEALLALGLMRIERKNRIGAAASMDELSKLAVADAPYYPLAAGVLAQCVGLAESSLTGTERDTAIKNYGDRAIEMLTAAVDAGWKDTGFLQTHKLLEPLRQRPEYRARLEALQKSAGTP
jgi:serine/threonine-protein kinase